jgi:hypothetical protein
MASFDPATTADTAATETEEYLGFVSTVEGTTRSMVRRAAGESTSSSGGVIFTEHDRPTLEDLFEQHQIVFAVLELPAPDLLTSGVSQDRVVASPRDGAHGEFFRTTSTARVAIAAANAAAVFTAGIVLIATTLADGIRADAEASVALALAGLGLIATVVASLAIPTRVERGRG